MTSVQNDHGTLVIENDELRVTVIPEAGGKIKSLISKLSGREFFHQDERPGSGEGYNASDKSGWDECFPNIRPCSYPVEPFQDYPLPDHGILWSRPNEWQPIANGVRLSITIPEFQLVLNREITLHGSTVSVHYHLTNQGKLPFLYLTDAHILFHWESGLHAELPPEVEQLYVYRSSKESMVTPGTWVKSNFWTEEMTHYSCKVITPPLQTGKISLHYGAHMTYRPESLHIHFDPQDLPYAALWIAKEDTDPEGNRIHCFSVQPTNLASATLPPKEWAGMCRTVNADSTNSWNISLQLSDPA